MTKEQAAEQAYPYPDILDKIDKHTATMVRQDVDKYREGFMKGWKANDRFLQGYACAVANMLRLEGSDNTQIRELFRDGIGKISNLKNKGIEPIDLELLKKYFK